MSLPSIDVVDNFLLLKLGCTYVILGMKWLQTLGKMQVNWGMLKIRFKIAYESVVLQGDPSLHKTQVSLKSMFKA